MSKRDYPCWLCEAVYYINHIIIAQDCMTIWRPLLKTLKGGVHPDYFVKLDFEIAVDQQTRARDRTFEGVPDSG